VELRRSTHTWPFPQPRRRLPDRPQVGFSSGWVLRSEGLRILVYEVGVKPEISVDQHTKDRYHAIRTLETYNADKSSTIIYVVHLNTNI